MSGPPPPNDLATRDPNWIVLDAGASLHRFFPKQYGPIFFDRTRSGRLNAPDESYGVLYTAQNAQGAFAETFLRTPERRMLDPVLLAQKAYVRLTVVRRFRLIEMDRTGLAALGATASVIHGDPPYDNAQAWSRALKAHPRGPDGIAYTSRHDPGQLCYALFEAPALVAEAERLSDLDDDWLWELADPYKIGLPPR